MKEEASSRNSDGHLFPWVANPLKLVKRVELGNIRIQLDLAYNIFKPYSDFHDSFVDH